MAASRVLPLRAQRTQRIENKGFISANSATSAAKFFAFPTCSIHPVAAMNFDYDVVIIGGAFSGAATALMLKRKRPSARVLIIEKTTEFDRKVGESTTEMSSCYMTRILGLSNYLGHEQLPKQGLRFWFCNRPDQAFDDCVEVGARYQARVPTFQVDRAKLDTHILELAVQAGCELVRPAKVTRVDLNGANGTHVSYESH